MFRKKIRQTHNFNLYSLLWIIAFAIFIYLMRDWYITKEFVGVVESKSHLLSAGESGRLQNVLVTIGDEVKKDQVLALLDVSDLMSTLNQLKDELATIQRLESAHRDRYSIEVRRMALQLENEAADLVERLSLIESQSTELAALNVEIERLSSAEVAGLGRSRELSALMLQRDALNTYLQEQSKDIEFQRRNLEKTRQSRTILERADIENITSSLLTEQMKYAEELRRLVTETEYRISLRTILAPCDGYVTDILARQGDAVDAFIPIFAVEETAPAFLDVYISDKSDLVPQVGMKVDIYSSRKKDFNTTGTISFVHPGFSMLSERFSYRGQFLWARKVQVELPKEHLLIPGEVVKVRVREHADNGDGVTLTANAAESSFYAPSSSAKHPPLSNIELGTSGHFLASGITWMPDINRYLIAGSYAGNDDAQTHLFLMDEGGAAESTPVPVVGLHAHEIKAIASAGNGLYYLVSSQNVQESTKGDDGDVIVQMKWDGEQFVLQHKLQLVPSLLDSHSPQQLAALGIEETGVNGLSIRIAGIACYDNALFFVLNEPASPKGAMIWRLNDVDDVFKSQKLKTDRISLFGYIRIGSSGDQTVDILDMAFDRNGVLWVSSATVAGDEKSRSGGFHRVTLFADGQLRATEIFSFPGLQPDGICLRNDDRLTIVLNDESGHPMFCSVDAEGL